LAKYKIRPYALRRLRERCKCPLYNSAKNEKPGLYPASNQYDPHQPGPFMHSQLRLCNFLQNHYLIERLDPDGPTTGALEKVVSITIGVHVDGDAGAVIALRTFHLLSPFMIVTHGKYR
jgi:hypothetical protein